MLGFPEWDGFSFKVSSLQSAAAAAVWATVRYLKFRWRRQEEETRQMYDMVERIIGETRHAVHALSSGFWTHLVLINALFRRAEDSRRGMPREPGPAALPAHPSCQGLAGASTGPVSADRVLFWKGWNSLWFNHSDVKSCFFSLFSIKLMVSSKDQSGFNRSTNSLLEIYDVCSEVINCYTDSVILEWMTPENSVLQLNNWSVHSCLPLLSHSPVLVRKLGIHN